MWEANAEGIDIADGPKLSPAALPLKKGVSAKPHANSSLQGQKALIDAFSMSIQ
jgi:hypothetical protein